MWISQPVCQYAGGDSQPGGQQLEAESAQTLRLTQLLLQCKVVVMSFHTPGEWPDCSAGMAGYCSEEDTDLMLHTSGVHVL